MFSLTTTGVQNVATYGATGYANNWRRSVVSLLITAFRGPITLISQTLETHKLSNNRLLACEASLCVFALGLTPHALSKNGEYESCVKALANSLLDIQHKVCVAAVVWRVAFVLHFIRS